MKVSLTNEEKIAKIGEAVARLLNRADERQERKKALEERFRSALGMRLKTPPSPPDGQ